ncbi:MAG: SDR family NAD(P)-dependent oxidoreductase [Pseudomonadota bacterium]
MAAPLAGPLTDRVAVVTGSGRLQGLGFAIARRLAEDGAKIVISDLGASTDARTPAAMIGDTDGMAAAVAAITQAGGEAVSQPCDVRRPDEVAALAQAAVDAYGRLDIWVNNAGIGYIMKPMLEVSPEDWSTVIDVNLSGCFFGVQAAARQMIAQGDGGAIINVASQAAKSGFPFAQAYCSSKHGLVGLVRSAAQELGEHQIRVNNVCPNHVTTGLGAWQNEYFADKLGKTLDEYMADMAGRIPMGRPGLPEDTANAVAFLCSDAARYITAESLNVSGGEEPH